MDKILHIDEYQNFLCGSPTNKIGSARMALDAGPRYCCMNCPTIGQVVPLPDGAFVPRVLGVPKKGPLDEPYSDDKTSDLTSDLNAK